jgi:hypothetical protein
MIGSNLPGLSARAGIFRAGSALEDNRIHSIISGIYRPCGTWRHFVINAFYKYSIPMGSGKNEISPVDILLVKKHPLLDSRGSVSLCVFHLLASGSNPPLEAPPLIKGD